MNNETIVVNKKMYDTMKCLVVALLDERENKEYILTKEHRKELIGKINIKVYAETLDSLDDRYYIL